MNNVQSFTFSPFSENTYVISDETHEAVIIDPGCLEQHEKMQLAAYIKENKLVVKALLQTHAHLDHVFGSAFVKRTYGVKMYLHAADVPILNDVEMRCKTWGIKGFEPVEADEMLVDGQKFSFGNTTFDVVHVPGHAPGHVAFINHNDRYIIGGDCLFQGSVGRTDFPMCSFEELMKSIQAKFYTLPDDYVVYAGHMAPTMIGIEKKTNPFTK